MCPAGGGLLIYVPGTAFRLQASGGSLGHSGAGCAAGSRNVRGTYARARTISPHASSFIAAGSRPRAAYSSSRE